MGKCHQTLTRLTLLGRVMVSGEFIHSLRVPTKAYPRSNADFMTRGLIKPLGAAMWSLEFLYAQKPQRDVPREV
jgi:hypothetical protein